MLRFIVRPFVAMSTLAVLTLPSSCPAVTEICGDHDGNGTIVASDALRVLRHAVGQDVALECPPACSPLTADTVLCGDHDSSGTIVASDALRVLRHAVGQVAALDCPASCPDPVCGDDSCNGAEMCSICASDCGGCMDCTGASDETTKVDAIEKEFLALLNAHRAEAGAGAVVRCTSLSRAAQGHAEEMRDNDYFSFTGLNGSTTYDRACSACFELGCGPQTNFAEVIAAGNAQAQATLDQLTDEVGENAALIGMDKTRVGIGRATGAGSYGTYWVIDLAAEGEASCN